MPTLTVIAPTPCHRCREPITCGVPWPLGVLFDPTRLMMVDAQGKAVFLQTRSLDHWPDGSVRWVLLDWQADLVDERHATYRVVVGEGPMLTPSHNSLKMTRSVDVVIIDTGTARFTMRQGGRFPFDAVTITDGPAFDPERSSFTLEDETGWRVEPTIEHLELVEDGPIRMVVRMKGRLGSLRLLAHCHVFAGHAVARIDLTLQNPRPAVHMGNLWDLGAGSSVMIRNASWTIALPSMTTLDETPHIYCSEQLRGTWRHFDKMLELYQDSSGGPCWDSLVHVNRANVSPLSFPGFRLRSDTGEEFGGRASPVVTLSCGVRTLTIAMEYYWQDFSKALEADTIAGTLTIRLFPQQSADVHELQGGERKTHRVIVAFAPDSISEIPLGWCRTPALATVEPSWYARAEAIPRLVPKADDPDTAHIELVDAAIVGEDTFEAKRERIDEYGWRHFGELYADHEAVFHQGDRPLVSHYNNQYDVVGGYIHQYLRSGDHRWWSLACEAARHVADIDIYHTHGDKSTYNNGLFWHTCHYVDAATSTHRAYPRQADVPGGGPSGGHLYTTGMMLHHFLTGDSLSRDAAMVLARYAIDADDGRRTVFRWLAKGHHTGHVSGSAEPGYHGPGRAPANAINALLDGHRLTGSPAFLVKAEQLIKRCVHPNDDIDIRRLLFAEVRWFYTMFLQALGKYLDVKVELSQFDASYTYARASLLHHARWMANHEIPYLDKPEVLQYPTETWAAQDMRKSDIFYLASRHTTVDESYQFKERACFFFDSSTQTLAALPTRNLARPLVLVLTNGWMHVFFRKTLEDRDFLTNAHSGNFNCRSLFVPQKVVALRRAKRIAFVVGGTLLIALVCALFGLLIG